MRSPRDGGPRQGASVNERLSGAMIRAVKRLLPERKVCERYGVTPVTLRRWDQDRRLNFPKAVVIRKRKYRDANELDEFDARLEGDSKLRASAW
jgi:hypothetical protein